MVELPNIDEANLLKEGMEIVGGAAGGAVGKIVGNEDSWEIESWMKKWGA